MRASLGADERCCPRAPYGFTAKTAKSRHPQASKLLKLSGPLPQCAVSSINERIIRSKCRASVIIGVY
jgi:hypothetical protein